MMIEYSILFDDLDDFDHVVFLFAPDEGHVSVGVDLQGGLGTGQFLEEDAHVGGVGQGVVLSREEVHWELDVAEVPLRGTLGSVYFQVSLGAVVVVLEVLGVHQLFEVHQVLGAGAGRVVARHVVVALVVVHTLVHGRQKPNQVPTNELCQMAQIPAWPGDEPLVSWENLLDVQ